MTRVACLMMQKDEALLLRPWLLYHSYLFGFENLFVYDNGSGDAAVLGCLREFAALGVRVDYSHTTPVDFADKGNIIGTSLGELQAQNAYDVALPLDCDEFVAIETDAGVVCTRSEIMAGLAAIAQAKAICRTSSGFYNVPGYFSLFQQAQHQKCIISLPAFAGIDHGFHQAALAPGAVYGETRIKYLHLHCKPFGHLQEGARQKLKPWIDARTASAEALADYANVGMHLTKYLRMDAQEYYAGILPASLPRLEITGLQKFLQLVMDFAALEQAWCEGRPEHAPRDSALAAMAAGQYAAAAALWARFVQNHPDDEEGYLYGALACEAAGLQAEAEALRAAHQRYFNL